MIVRHFLSWVRNASAGERADATRALARAFLISDMSEDDRFAAEGALLSMLDDRAPMVRQAMSDVFAASHDAPPAIIRVLATDQPAIALPVIEHSPLLTDADLVDFVATGMVEIQTAIARRLDVSGAVAAAIAEVGEGAACLELLENSLAEIAQFSLDRIVDRFGHLAAIREVMLQREDLAPQTRLALANKLSETLSQFAATNNWFSAGRAIEFSTDVRERNIVEIAARTDNGRLPELVRHLRESAELTSGLVLRALLCGNETFFEAALVELSGLAPQRVAALVWDRGGAGLTALLERSGFPHSTFIAIRAAVDALLEPGFVNSDASAAHLRLRVVERALTACEAQPSQAMQSILVLLRRFETESARAEARFLCDDIVAEDAAAAIAALESLEDALLDESDAVAFDDDLETIAAGDEAVLDDQELLQIVPDDGNDVVADDASFDEFSLLAKTAELFDDNTAGYELTPEMTTALEAALLGEGSENPVSEDELRSAVDLNIAEYSRDDLSLMDSDAANDQAPVDDEVALKEFAAGYFGLGDIIPARHRAAA
jgi:uncharacterized protein (DUF2336 family)